MTETQKQYYQKMLGKDRLMPIILGDRLAGMITFYIGNDMDIDKYVRDNMWDVLDDNEKGNVLFIDQMITDKNEHNYKFSFKVWRQFKNFVKLNFPLVKTIRWNRWYKENNIVKVYRKEI